MESKTPTARLDTPQGFLNGLTGSSGLFRMQTAGILTTVTRIPETGIVRVEILNLNGEQNKIEERYVIGPDGAYFEAFTPDKSITGVTPMPDNLGEMEQRMYRKSAAITVANYVQDLVSARNPKHQPMRII